MELTTFNDLSRALGRGTTRRRVGTLLLGLGLGSSAGSGLLGAAETDAKNKSKQKRRRTRRRKRARKWQQPVQPQQPSPSIPSPELQTPFTIEVHWTDPSNDPDTYLFVPNAEGTTVPFPSIDLFCRANSTACETDVYPYVCVDDGDPVAEITTIRQLLPGVYEYWIQTNSTNALPEGLQVLLRNADGQILRSWSVPPNPFPATDVAWHVLNLDGSTGHITSVSDLVDANLPYVYGAQTDVCPS